MTVRELVDQIFDLISDGEITFDSHVQIMSERFSGNTEGLESYDIEILDIGADCQGDLEINPFSIPSSHVPS